MRRHVLLPLLSLIFAGWMQVQAQNTTAFTYQGRLQSGTNLASGTYKLRFTVYDALTSGSIVGGPVTNAVTVTNGLFTVVLDLGAAPFPGASRWIEVAVRLGNSGNFSVLN